ncbi:MAG TPA: bifunctional glutamate N-acetyltransferase/amino-acid acetyltransferase ArgJ [Geothermobacteraceae bacterium]|nr:bifunctional glutamate N-acetyltransferase/amino-acid acetyltransferase ArgJ [Geothermobacteraceae bacterium]
MSDAVTLPQLAGFRFATLAAGIKKPGKLDLGLIYSDVPARCAGVFTTNKVVAAPVTLTAPRIKRQLCQAILVNSGNANACTGELGFRDAGSCGQQLADALGIDAELVAVASTGVIGKPLPMDKFAAAIPQLPERLAADGARQLAESIMTTDSFAKLSTQSGEVQGAPYQILGIAKGAGMIHPNMATMLAFVLTDAAVSAELLTTALKQGVDQSFNVITVDRDTSTNDMVLLLANGESGAAEILPGTKEAERFGSQLNQVLLDLAKMIVRDGEGATKLVEIRIEGALDADQARQAACSVATSNLVKTAFFGEDANWGRIIAAVGYSGAEVIPEKVSISFDAVPVVKDGLGTGADLEREATAVLKQPEFRVTVDLGLGAGTCSYYTSDLTYDYVRINADYRT